MPAVHKTHPDDAQSLQWFPLVVTIDHRVFQNPAMFPQSKQIIDNGCGSGFVAASMLNIAETRVDVSHKNSPETAAVSVLFPPCYLSTH